MSHPQLEIDILTRPSGRDFLLSNLLKCIVVVSALAFSGIAAARPDCLVNPTHPSCKPDEPTGSGVFDVVISGDVDGLGLDWLQESGQSQIVYNDFWDTNGGMITDLSFFRGLFVGGANCFPLADTPLFLYFLPKSCSAKRSSPM